MAVAVQHGLEHIDHIGHAVEVGQEQRAAVERLNYGALHERVVARELKLQICSVEVEQIERAFCGILKQPDVAGIVQRPDQLGVTLIIAIVIVACGGHCRQIRRAGVFGNCCAKVIARSGRRHRILSCKDIIGVDTIDHVTAVLCAEDGSCHIPVGNRRAVALCNGLAGH